MKRFITNGDSDIHLVLARSEESTHDGRGLSMFIYDNREHKATRINESCVRERGETIGSSSDGAERSQKDGGVNVRRIENKLGIHGSPTCELVYKHAVSLKRLILMSHVGESEA